MLVTGGERSEAGILRQLRHADDLSERLKELLLRAGDRDITVGGGKELERHDARVGRQRQAPRLDSGRKPPCGLVTEHGQCGVEERGVEVAAATGAAA